MKHEEEKAYKRLILCCKINGVLKDNQIRRFLCNHKKQDSYLNIKTVRVALEHNLRYDKIKLI